MLLSNFAIGQKYLSLPSRLLALLVSAFFLASCSFSPVYGPGARADTAYDLAFKTPGSRLEQIVYQELVARFGRSTSADAILVEVKVSGSSIRPGDDSIGVEGEISLFYVDPFNIEPDVRIYNGTRFASASYTSSPQSVAEQQAANEATERAAQQLAETVRLTLFGVLATIEQQGGPAAIAARQTTISDD